MADALDSKSGILTGVRVRVPSSVLCRSEQTELNMNPNVETRMNESVRPSVSARLSDVICSFCGTRLNVHEAARGSACAKPVCQKKHADMLRTQRLQRESDEVQKAATDFRARVADSYGIKNPEELPLGIVPVNHRRVTKTPRSRRMEFRAHLIRVVLQAFEEKLDQAGIDALGEELTEAVRSSAPLDAGAGCATCQGFCCRLGETHAHLTASSIRSFVVRNPGLRWREVVRVFLKYLPEETYEQSCVYQGRRGCGLPREMRAATCNHYRCDGLKQLHARLEEAGSPRALIVAAEGVRIDRATLLSAEGKSRPVSVARCMDAR